MIFFILLKFYLNHFTFIIFILSFINSLTLELDANIIEIDPFYIVGIIFLFILTFRFIVFFIFNSFAVY